MELDSKFFSDSEKLKETSDEKIVDQYEIEECAEWILQRDFRSVVTLQFPDHLLCDAVRVSELLEKRIGVKSFILADTSYGSCCVDEIAAQHANAQCILHFGEACMSAGEGRIPVRYVFPRINFDADDFRNQLLTNYDKLGFTSYGKVLLVIDVSLHHVAEEINTISKDILSSECISFNLSQCSGDIISDSADGGLVFFVGSTSINPRITLLMLTNPTQKFVSYDPTLKVFREESTRVNQMLRKRLYLIEKIRDASIIGIVVGALNVKGYLNVVDRMKTLCRMAGKKFVVLSVGKINVAKVSNFVDAADAFVWISCPFNIILETSDYPYPIVTPFEMEVAYNPHRHWHADSGWTTDFSRLLADQNENTEGGGETDQETDISLITGSLRRLGTMEKTTDENALLSRSDAMRLNEFSIETRFVEKTWKGLEERLGETEVTSIREGRTGIASAYDTERKD